MGGGEVVVVEGVAGAAGDGGWTVAVGGVVLDIVEGDCLGGRRSEE